MLRNVVILDPLQTIPIIYCRDGNSLWYKCRAFSRNSIYLFGQTGLRKHLPTGNIAQSCGESASNLFWPKIPGNSVRPMWVLSWYLGMYCNRWVWYLRFIGCIVTTKQYQRNSTINDFFINWKKEQPQLLLKDLLKGYCITGVSR